LDDVVPKPVRPLDLQGGATILAVVLALAGLVWNASEQKTRLDMLIAHSKQQDGILEAIRKDQQATRESVARLLESNGMAPSG